MPNLSKKIWGIKKGGDAGEIFIAARKIRGGGDITADGGDGNIGGKGGKITVISEDNKLRGKISANGGKVLRIFKWYEKWWGILILGIVASLVAAVIYTYVDGYWK